MKHVFEVQFSINFSINIKFFELIQECIILPIHPKFSFDLKYPLRVHWSDFSD